MSYTYGYYTFLVLLTLILTSESPSHFLEIVDSLTVVASGKGQGLM